VINIYKFNTVQHQIWTRL